LTGVILLPIIKPSETEKLLRDDMKTTQYTGDRAGWLVLVAKKYINATIVREGNWTWAVVDDEDVAMHSVVLNGGWIK
jgi:hypothetical protein